MIIQITPDGFIHLSGDVPKVGTKYALEDATEGSNNQLRAFHPLVKEFFISGLHSYNCSSWLELKEFIKRDLGEGFESFIYSDVKGIHKVKTEIEIPENTPYTHKLGKLKSLADYTNKQRIRLLDGLISTMIQAGVQSKKFFEVLSGMEKEKQ